MDVKIGKEAMVVCCFFFSWPFFFFNQD